MAPGNRRDILRPLVVVGFVAAAVAVLAVPLEWAPWSRTLPEVERGNARCPSPSSDPRPTPSGSGPLVPDARYHMVQLCAPATVERTPFRLLDDRTSTEIVDQLNALSVEPPSPTCATGAAQNPVDLVLRGNGTTIVVRLDTGPCGSAHRDGVVRYGAGDLYRYTTALLAN